MTKRRLYPSDLSYARWELIVPVLAAWRLERRGRVLDFGRPPEHDLRDVMDAILYLDRTGVQCCYLPHDFPHWNTVYGYFAKWATRACSPRARHAIARQPGDRLPDAVTRAGTPGEPRVVS